MRAALGTQAPKHQRGGRGCKSREGPLATRPSTLPGTPRASGRGWAEAFPKPQSPRWTTVRAHSCSDGLQGPRARPPACRWWGGTGQETPGFPGHRPPQEPQAAFSHLLTPPHLPPERRLSWPLSAAGSALRAGVHPGDSHRPTADRAFQPPPSPPRSPSPLGAPHRRPQIPPPFRPPASITEPALPPRLRHRRGPETQGCRLRHPRARREGSGPPACPGPRRPGAAAPAAGQRPSARASAAAGQGQRAARAEPQPVRSGEAAALLAQRGGGAGAVGAAAPRGGGPRRRRGAGGAAIGGEGACRSGRGGPGWGRQAGRERGLRRAKGRGTGLMGRKGGLLQEGAAAGGGGVARRQRRGAWERGEGGGRMGAVRTGPMGRTRRRRGACAGGESGVGRTEGGVWAVMMGATG